MDLGLDVFAHAALARCGVFSHGTLRRPGGEKKTVKRPGAHSPPQSPSIPWGTSPPPEAATNSTNISPQPRHLHPSQTNPSASASSGRHRLSRPSHQSQMRTCPTRTKNTVLPQAHASVRPLGARITPIHSTNQMHTCTSAHHAHPRSSRTPAGPHTHLLTSSGTLVSDAPASRALGSVGTDVSDRGD